MDSNNPKILMSMHETISSYENILDFVVLFSSHFEKLVLVVIVLPNHKINNINVALIPRNNTNHWGN